MNNVMNVRSIEELQEQPGTVFSFKGNEGSLWKVDDGGQTASLLCDHGEPDRYLYLTDFEGARVFVLDESEIQSHRDHIDFDVTVNLERSEQ